MQYVRQSLVTICVCLYTFLAITLGLTWLVNRSSDTTAVGFYHPDLPINLIGDKGDFLPTLPISEEP